MSPRISIRLLGAQSDQRLLALAREGHERAFEALVQRYRRPLLRYARARMCLSDARAEDVVQQSFMQSWLALSRGVVVHDVRSWLYRIVHNTAVNAMRGPEAHRELTQAVEDRAGLARGSNLERRIALRDALGHVAALPDMQRQAIFLTAVDGQSHEEVAGTLGISTGALRGLLYRARHTLRSAAAALTPQPLLELAARSGDAAAPGAERVLELTGGAGAAGIAGLLLKGGAAAVTAGALATGAVLAGHRHPASHAHSPKSLVAASAGPTSLSRSPRPPAALGLPSTRTLTPDRLRRPPYDARVREPGAHGRDRGEGTGRGGASGPELSEHGLAPFVRRVEHSRTTGRSERSLGPVQELNRAPRGDDATSTGERSRHSGDVRRDANGGTGRAELAGAGSGETPEYGSGGDQSSGAPEGTDRNVSESSGARSVEGTSREGSPGSPSNTASTYGSGETGSGGGERDPLEKVGDAAQPE